MKINFKSQNNAKCIIGLSNTWWTDPFKSHLLLVKKYVQVFADRVHISNRWILVQALAHTPDPNCDMP